MSPTRRQVVSAVATGAALPATVTAASARQEDDDQGFSPDITFNSNNLVATIGDRDGEVDPDSVTIHTADGSAITFDEVEGEDWQAGEAFEVGYTNPNQQDTRARIENWHGILERVEATKDDQTVSETNDNESTLEVSCSLWQTPDEPPTEFTVLSEGARKQHWNRGDQDLSEDQRQYGSPGRPIWTVAEENPEIAMHVDFVECDPGTEKALWFDCTTVTVTGDELNQGEDRIEGVQLTFNDDTTEHPPGTADDADNGAYELPVTLSGSGENDGKVIKKLHFQVERGEYTYWNLEAEECSSEQGDEEQGDSDGGSPDSGDDDSDSGDDGTGDDDSGSGESTDTPTGEEPTGDDAEEPTATPDASDDSGGSSDGDGGGSSGGDGGGSSGGDGGGGGGGDAGGGNAGGGSSGSGGSDGSSDGVYEDDTDDTPTPRSVEVGNGTGDPARTATADDAAGSTATASPNGSAGAGNATAEGADDPVTTEGIAGEDQPGMGFVSALGGLLGLGELARRRLDTGETDTLVDDEE